jgi:hypothetical protein
VKQKESFDNKNTSELEQEGVTRAWGTKHRAPDEYLKVVMEII